MTADVTGWRDAMSEAARRYVAENRNVVEQYRAMDGEWSMFGDPVIPFLREAEAQLIGWLDEASRALP